MRLGDAGRVRRATLFGSASIRLAALYGLVFGLSALALVAFLWWETADLLDRQVEVAINADAQSLAERWQEGGIASLVATISERLRENVGDDAIYLVTDAAGRTLDGNLTHWPSGVLRADAWYELPVERDGVRSLARVRAFNLPGGYHLLVGRDVRTRAQLRRLLTDALFWALFIVIALGVAGAAVMRGLFRHMLARVSTTAAAISAGNLGQRVRLSGRGDEFDRLAETINDMLDRIARLMDGVRQVSNAIAHDLRTPIARARARLEDAGAHARDEEALRAAVERATADLDAVTAVFEALLRIAEIEAGARRSAFAPLDIAPLLSDLAELYTAAAEERGLRLEVSAPIRLLAYGDRELIQQAVANLLDNAVKFSPPGSTVELAAIGEAGVVRITVTDRGPGIPEPDRTRATERFFRGESARSTPGMGLGLALVQAVAQLHGGELRLEDARPGLRAVLVLAAREEAGVTQVLPHRVLVDLSHAADGYVGIAQDVRLIFDMLTRLPGVAPAGLLMPTGRHDLPRLDPDDAAAAAAVLHWMARNWESRRFPRLLGRLGPVADLPRLLRRRHGLIPLRLPPRSGALWRVLFEKTLAPERREAVLRCPFLATDLSVMRIIDRALLLPRLAPKLLDARGFDAVLFCMPRPVRLPPRVRQIVRFHDAVPLTDIDTVSGWRIAVAHRRLVRLCSPDTVFVCNSPQSVEDLALLDPSRAERAQVIPCALPERVAAALPVAAIVASRRSFRALGDAAGAPHGLAPFDGQPRYVLTVSTLEPRKNYPNLIRAWERVVQRHDPELKLVIVANRGWREAVILREMAPHVRAGRILHLQDVPRDELAALARAATCFAFPSFGEGFGYPPLEAMQAGTPSVVSDIPVFRWLLGDAALFVDPYDVEAIAAAIARLADGGDAGAALRAELLAHAPAMLARFAPDLVAAQWAALLDALRTTPAAAAIMPAV